MAGYRITQRIPHPVVYAYGDAVKALRKVRALERVYADFEIRDATTEQPVSIAELEAAAGKSDEPS